MIFGSRSLRSTSEHSLRSLGGALGAPTWWARTTALGRHSQRGHQVRRSSSSTFTMTTLCTSQGVAIVTIRISSALPLSADYGWPDCRLVNNGRRFQTLDDLDHSAYDVVPLIGQSKYWATAPGPYRRYLTSRTRTSGRSEQRRRTPPPSWRHHTPSLTAAANPSSDPACPSPVGTQARSPATAA